MSSSIDTRLLTSHVFLNQWLWNPRSHQRTKQLLYCSHSILNSTHIHIKPLTYLDIIHNGKEKKTADTLQEAYLQRLPLQFFTSQSIVTSELIERQSPSLSCWPFIILAIVMLCWCSHTAWGQLTLTSFPLRGEADSSALHLINKEGYMRRKQMYDENKTLSSHCFSWGHRNWWLTQSLQKMTERSSPTAKTIIEMFKELCCTIS